MSLETTSVIICDRCKKREITKPQVNMYPWGRLHIHQQNGPFRVTGNCDSLGFAGADLCPSCVEDFKYWWDRH